jgi:hypothetical protein
MASESSALAVENVLLNLICSGMQLKELLFSPALEILLDDVSTVVKMWPPSDINKLSTAASKFRIFKNKN